MPVSRRGFIALPLIGFSSAVLATAWVPVLPSPGIVVVLVAVGIVALARTRTVPLAGVVFGFAWAAASAHYDVAHRIAGCAEGGVVELTGRIVGLPKPSSAQIQFDIEPIAIEPWPTCAGALPRRLRLSWFGGPIVGTGETWQMRVRLRGIRGYQNPGGFDYEAWALSNRIDGAGTVRYGELREVGTQWSWDALRASLRTRIGALGLTHTGIVLGLLTGDGGLMSDADWALFRATGTVHLMVISGLHLAIAATIGVAFGRAIARLFPSSLRRRGAAWFGAVTGTIMVTLYACLAGWGVPVQRAWLATVLVVWALLFGRRHSLPLLFLWVGALILVDDALAPLQAGFWLSFGAVAVLLAQFSPRLGRHSPARDLIVAQLALACAMVPLLAATIGGIVWLGPVANLIAVPLVSVIVVPGDLLGALLLYGSPRLANWVFWGVDSLVAFVVAYLRAIATFNWVAWQSGFGLPALVISTGASLLLLLPTSVRHRMLLLPCVLLPVVPVTSALDDGAFRVTVLDVGQGLAVLVDTARHRLLFDAGPRYPGGLDLGRAVVLPSLNATGSARLDAVILSHADIDHVGGFPTLASLVPIRALLGGEPVPGVGGLQPCRRGRTWQWDGVRFRVLHPFGSSSTDNDRSCVLLVDNGRERVLLPGDISAASEMDVLSQLRGIHVDVLVAAHHGSRSSSTLPFLRGAMPRLVIVSAGYMSRFGHPHPDVVCRFIATGARVFVTAWSGALEWRSQQPERLREWRRIAPPYWRVGIDDPGVSNPEHPIKRIDGPCPAGAQ